MTTRLFSLIDDIEACFDSLSLTTSGPDELRQKLAALRKAVALPADTAVVGEAVAWRWRDKRRGTPWHLVHSLDAFSGPSLETIEIQALVPAEATRSPTGGREAGLEKALRKVRDIANGRDALDGFPRSTDEKQRRLATIYEVAVEAVGSDALLPSQHKAGS